MNTVLSTAHSIAFHIKDNPHLPHSSAIKFAAQLKLPTYHTIHHCSQFLHTSQTIPAMLSSNYIAATHNTYNTLHAHQRAQHTAIPSPLPSTTLLCTQLTNTKHSWQNGTRCRDGANVLWCRSHLVRLVFERFIPTCACFHSENFFVTRFTLIGRGGVFIRTQIMYLSTCM